MKIKNPLKTVGLVALALCIAGIVFAAWKVQSFYNRIYKTQGGKAQPSLPPDKKIFTIALLGYGGGTHDGAYLTDSMMLVRIDTEKNQIHIFSIPRDLWYKLPTKSGATFHMKANALYEIGLFPTDFPDVAQVPNDESGIVKMALQTITSLPVDNYVGIDFAGFEKVIDILGGVDINVKTTFDDYEYPIDGKEKDLCGKDEAFKKVEKYLDPTKLSATDITDRDALFAADPNLANFAKNIVDSPPDAFPCRYEHLHFNKGLTHMDGARALKYVRSRHGLQDGSDFGRSARQQLFIAAVKEKIVSVGILPKIIPLLDEMKTHIKTDITVAEIEKFVGEAKELNTYQIHSYVLSDQNALKNDRSADGQYILAAKEGIDIWSGVNQTIQNVIAGITPTPTPSPTPKVTPTKHVNPN